MERHLLTHTRRHRQYGLSRNSDGFTLIEVLIALAVFSIGVLAVAKLQTVTVRNTTRANVITQATMLAQTRMDELKSFESMTDLDLENAIVENSIDEFGNPGGVFTRTTTVATLPALPAPANSMGREITVKVSWVSGWRGHSEVALNSITQGNGI